MREWQMQEASFTGWLVDDVSKIPPGRVWPLCYFATAGEAIGRARDGQFSFYRFYSTADDSCVLSAWRSVCPFCLFFFFFYLLFLDTLLCSAYPPAPSSLDPIASIDSISFLSKPRRPGSMRTISRRSIRSLICRVRHNRALTDFHPSPAPLSGAQLQKLCVVPTKLYSVAVSITYPKRGIKSISTINIILGTIILIFVKAYVLPFLCFDVLCPSGFGSQSETYRRPAA